MDSLEYKATRGLIDLPEHKATRGFMDSPTQRAMSEAARVNQWMSRLGDKSTNMLLALMPRRTPILEDGSLIRYASASMASSIAEIDYQRLSGILGLNVHLSDTMEATRLKLATLAGSGDVLGFEI